MPETYIVMGATGEYSDAQEWAVVGYATKQAAGQHAYSANDWLLANGLHEDSLTARDAYYRYEDALPKNPWDENMKFDYTGTRYYVVAIPFHPRARSAVKPRAT